MIVEAKFEFGRVVGTHGVTEVVSEEDRQAAMIRFVQGDWGNICEEDKQVNEDALKYGNRLMGVYESSTGVKFWLITEWDRSVTTFLLPSEY